MLRKQRQGLNVGGAWIVPNRDTVSRPELALVLEMPESVLKGLLEDESGCEVEVEAARDLLSDLARAGFIGCDETYLFGELIAGRRRIGPNGAVFLALEGEVMGGPLEYRTTAPPNAVAFDRVRWQRHLASRRRLG